MEIDHNTTQEPHVKKEIDESLIKLDPDDPTNNWGDTTMVNRGHKSGGEKVGNGEEEGSEDDGEDVFEVERVVGHQYVPDAGLYYYLKWKGYDDKDNTWEPENSVYCHGYVNEYWTRYEATGGKKSDRINLEQERQKERRKSLTSSSKSNANEADQGALLPDLTPLLNQARQPEHLGANSTIDNSNNRGESSSLKTLDKSRQTKSIGKRRSKENLAQDTTASGTESRKNKGSESSGWAASVVNIKAEDCRNRGDVSKDSSFPSKRKRVYEPDDWTPPTSWESWEDKVDLIEAVEQRQVTGKRELVVHLLWKTGSRTEHLARDVHRRCPQKLLDFYESHLIFREEQDNSSLP